MKLGEYIEQFKGLEKEKLIEELKKTPLSAYQRNIIYVYQFPTNLKHMELVEKIQTYRTKTYGNIVGLLVPEQKEILMLLNAYGCRQYKNYIRHLLHSFLGDNVEVNFDDGDKILDCGICGKPVAQYKKWQEQCQTEYAGGQEIVRKEHLAFNGESDIVTCINCLVQLSELHKILKDIEGEDYLTRFSNKDTK
jgi:hypothetical protein